MNPIVISLPVALGSEFQHFVQSLSFLFKGPSSSPWVESTKYSFCAATGAVLELVLVLWRTGAPTTEALSSSHDMARGGEPVLRIRIPDAATAIAASNLAIRSFFSRWETYSERGMTFLIVSATQQTIEPYLPKERLALTVPLHGLDEAVVF